MKYRHDMVTSLTPSTAGMLGAVVFTLTVYGAAENRAHSRATDSFPG